MQDIYAAHRAALLETDYIHAGDREHPVFGEGPLGADLMLIGEAPGRDEAALGRPFVGRAGRYLDELLREAGIDRSQVFVTNTVKFRPTRAGARCVSNRPPDPFEVEQALPLLRMEILHVKPRLIASLGNTPLGALQRLGGIPGDVIGNMHGRLWPLRIGDESFGLFPLYHPASVLYNPALREVQRLDVEKLRLCLEGLE